MELFALLLSWLNNAGCPVINAASASSLAGSPHPPMVWQHLASRAGLMTPQLLATTSTRRFPPSPGAIPRPDLVTQADISQSDQIGLNRFGWFSERLSSGTRSVL